MGRYSNYGGLADQLERIRARAGAAERDALERPPRQPRIHALVRRLSNDDVETLVSEYERGDGPEAIANRHGISTTALYDLLAERGVPRRRMRLTDDEVEEMRTLRATGESYAAIGRRFGVSRTAVSLRLSAPN